MSRHLLAVQIALCIVQIAVRVSADERPSFRTGKALDEALTVPVQFVATNAGLDDALDRLSVDWNVAILRDRRVDPRRLISLKTESGPRLQVLSLISREVPDIAVTRTADVLIFGPVDTVHCIPVLVERHRAQLNDLRRTIPSDVAKALYASRPVRWERLAEPRQILIDHANLAGVTIANPDAIPWDLWDAASLPSMTFSELATLLLNQFDLAFVVTPGTPTIQIVPMNLDEIVDHRHRFDRATRAIIEAQLNDAFPDAKLSWTATMVTATAPLRVHAQIGTIIFDAAAKSSPGASAAVTGSLKTRLFALDKTRATVGNLITALREQNIVMDVRDGDTEATRTTLKKTIMLEAMTSKQSGSDFFPMLFGEHFSSVEVLDDRVILRGAK